MPTPDLSAARFFADLPDSRRDRTREHGLTDILVIALAAIAGAESFEAVAAFGWAKKDGLARFFPLAHGRGWPPYCRSCGSGRSATRSRPRSTTTSPACRGRPSNWAASSGGTGRWRTNGTSSSTRSTRRRIIGTGAEPIPLYPSADFYTLYAPPNHRDGVVHPTRADAEAGTEHFDGKMTE